MTVFISEARPNAVITVGCRQDMGRDVMTLNFTACTGLLHVMQIHFLMLRQSSPPNLQHRPTTTLNTVHYVLND